MSKRTQLILLMDDDEIFRSGLADNLRDDGYQVVEYSAPTDLPASDGFANIAAAVIEHDLPSSSGLKFADQFHAAHPEVPVVLVTGYCTPDLQAMAAARGFIHLLPKPVVYEELHTLLGRELTSRFPSPQRNPSR